MSGRFFVIDAPHNSKKLQSPKVLYVLKILRLIFDGKIDDTMKKLHNANYVYGKMQKSQKICKYSVLNKLKCKEGLEIKTY